MKEGYSREAVEANEAFIDENRELASGRAFNGNTDPSDIISAKFNYNSGKERRKELEAEAWDEAIVENDARNAGETKESPKSFRVGDFSKIVLKTDTGNTYTIQKSSDGERYSILNERTGLVIEVSNQQIADQRIAQGVGLLFGNGGNTSPVISGKFTF